MEYKVLAIYDDQSTYADLLTRELLRISSGEFQVQNFTSKDQLIAFCKEETITWLIISEPLKSLCSEVSAQSYFCLTQERGRGLIDISGKKVGCIYRYQPVQELYKIISNITAKIYVCLG